MDEILNYLDKAVTAAIAAGIDRNKIIIDPGIGFGKTVEHNLEILKRLKELKILGFPILVGPSRKSFIGKILNAGPQMRLFGTVSACVLAAANGAHMVRAHDVKPVYEALRVTNAILNKG
jgi:dihydropteroate synthase